MFTYVLNQGSLVWFIPGYVSNSSSNRTCKYDMPRGAPLLVLGVMLRAWISLSTYENITSNNLIMPNLCFEHAVKTTDTLSIMSPTIPLKFKLVHQPTKCHFHTDTKLRKIVLECILCWSQQLAPENRINHCSLKVYLTSANPSRPGSKDSKTSFDPIALGHEILSFIEPGTQLQNTQSGDWAECMPGRLYHTIHYGPNNMI